MRGQKPVLFVLRAEHYGRNKIFLNNGNLSAFPDEKEYLLGYSFWEVTKVEEASKIEKWPEMIEALKKKTTEEKWTKICHGEALPLTVIYIQ